MVSGHITTLILIRDRGCIFSFAGFAEHGAELCNKRFYAQNGDICNIEKALQTIEVELDREGGKIKSEALSYATMSMSSHQRYFYLNDEFTMFLKESDKNVPYFAANIKDITLFQN